MFTYRFFFLNVIIVYYHVIDALHYLVWILYLVDLMEGYKAIELNVDDNKGERSLVTQCQAVPDMKFTYVVSCQQYGIHKRSGDHRAQDILRLMTKYVYAISFLLNH